jgi:hypothetical protein
MTSLISRFRWPMRGLVAMTLALVFALSSTISAFAFTLVQLSSDPYTNTTSQHKTEVEPDTLSSGSTIVSTFQVGRFFNGGASNIGFATSTNGGKSFISGFLPSSTVFATPPGVYPRASDPSVAFDAKDGAWLISWLGIVTPSGPVDVLVSRSTDGGRTWGAPIVVNKDGHFNDKNWTVCDNTSTSPFFGHCYTEFDDNTLGDLIQMSTSPDGGLTWERDSRPPTMLMASGGNPSCSRAGPWLCRSTASRVVRVSTFSLSPSPPLTVGEAGAKQISSPGWASIMQPGAFATVFRCLPLKLTQRAKYMSSGRTVILNLLVTPVISC